MEESIKSDEKIVNLLAFYVDAAVVRVVDILKYINSNFVRVKLLDDDLGIDVIDASSPHRQDYRLDEIRQAIRKSKNHMYVEFIRHEFVPDSMVIKRDERDRRCYFFYSHPRSTLPYAVLFTLPDRLANIDCPGGGDDKINLYQHCTVKRGAVMLVADADVITYQNAIDHNIVVPDFVQKFLFANE
uniref:Mutant ORF3 n=1 Tax=Spodoptera litura multicapsid nucleopolyhedrovirus TaxID=46242 RepID=D5K690_NPVST|nr:mutant ORF3 [Spodoptera litura nucleopolyhedrovirus]